MPEAHTKHFATISYDESAVVTFPSGLPAFEHLKRFVLLERASTSPVVFLQSLDDAERVSAGRPIPAICPDYELALTGRIGLALEATPGKRCAGLSGGGFDSGNGSGDCQSSGTDCR
jgi:flagellar assembly factor FliW